MRKLIYFFIVAGALYSCQNNKYTITGTIADVAYEGSNVYLRQMADSVIVSTDTAVVQNGVFSFSGTTEAPALRFVVLDEAVESKQANESTLGFEREKKESKQAIKIPLMLEPGKIEVVFDSVISVKGTPLNEAYTDFRLKQREMRLSRINLEERFNSETNAGTMTDSLETELKDSYAEIGNLLTDLSFNFVKDNIGNKLGEYVFENSAYGFKPDKQKEILELAGEEFKAGEKIQGIIERLKNFDNVAVGKKFVDLTLKDPEGNEVSLSDYAGKGNYLLIDFWAAWCGPCRQEMPNVVEAYKIFKPKGFEVVGVSLDEKHEKWTQGIKDLNMTWPQMSDLLYWKSPVVDLYAINGIPHTVLLDKEGTIIEKNLRGDDLIAKLTELMP